VRHRTRQIAIDLFPFSVETTTDIHKRHRAHLWKAQSVSYLWMPRDAQSVEKLNRESH
jgi:hypothetical protein